jgi:hypothetical protein
MPQDVSQMLQGAQPGAEAAPETPEAAPAAPEAAQPTEEVPPIQLAEPTTTPQQ